MHLRKCDSNQCENPATHWLVWTKPQFMCEDCARKMITIGRAIGIETPQTTLRLLSPEEMFVSDEND